MSLPNGKLTPSLRKTDRKAKKRSFFHRFFGERGQGVSFGL
jgi:hypothetical protein